MRSDYHMHPQILRENSQANQFVEQAIKNGLTEICFTDHMPLSVCNAADRIKKGKVKEYCQRVSELADKYKKDIIIKTGIEIDYHPDYTGEIEQVLSEGSFDYVLGSSHLHISGYGIDFTSLTADDFVAITLNNILASVKSGYFDGISHMEMYLWVIDNPQRFPLRTQTVDYNMHRDKICDILDEIAKRKIFLEINSHRMADKGNIDYAYPSRTVLKLAADREIRYRFGSDAHIPEHVGFGLKELENDPLYGRCLNKFL